MTSSAEYEQAHQDMLEHMASMSEKWAEMLAAVDLLEALKREGLEPSDKEAAAAAKAMPSVQKWRDGSKKWAEMLAAVAAEALKREGESDPEQQVAAAKAMPSVQNHRDGSIKGGKGGKGGTKIRRGAADGGSRKIRNTEGSRPFVIKYRTVLGNEHGECFGSIRKDGEFLLRIDDKNDPVLFAIMMACGYKTDEQGRLRIVLRFNEGPDARFVFTRPSSSLPKKMSGFFARCTIISGRLLTPSELEQNEKEASDRNTMQKKLHRKLQKNENKKARRSGCLGGD